jgi:hypothetical protein
VELVSGLRLREAMPVPSLVPVIQALVPAPLGHQEVADVPPRAKPAGSKEARKLEKECNADIRKIKKSDRDQQGACRVKLLDFRWADGRYRAARFCIWLLTRDNGMAYEFGGALGSGLLSRAECSEAVRLLDKAAQAAAGHPNSHSLETASAPFWALVLALQVCRQRTGLVIETDAQKRCFSFQGMVDAHEQMKQLSVGQRIPEPFYDFAAEVRRPELDRTLGPIKYVGKHSLGSSAKVWKKKIECLNAMLKLAGEDGLCFDVLNMRGPTQVVYEQPPAESRKAKAAATSGWGKKTRERGLVLAPRGAK